jgi:hypothetical protein
MAYQLIKQKRCPLKFCILGFFLVFLLNSNSVFAAQNDAYTVNDVIASGSGKSPSQARTNAVTSAQRNAFLILLDRLGIDSSTASSIDDAAISDMVASQQILGEKVAGNNYSATLNLSFSESFVKHYLGKKVAAAEDKKETANSYLIVPVKLIKNQSLIWETNNDWKVAWENILKANKVSYLKLAKGEIDDIATITPSAVDNPHFTDFEQLLNKYKTDGLMLVYFDFDSIENKVNIVLQNIQKFNTTKTKLDFVNVNQLSPEDLVNKVAEKTFDYIASIVDKDGVRSSPLTAPTTIQTGISTYQIDILIYGLDDWLKVKNKLENSNLVSQFRVESLSRDLVKIIVSYNNSNGDIINAFAKNNLYLQKKTEGGYFLSLTKPQQ